MKNKEQTIVIIKGLAGGLILASALLEWAGYGIHSDLLMTIGQSLFK